MSDETLKEYFARLLGALAEISPTRVVCRTTSQVEERSEQALVAQRFINVIQLCHHSVRQILAAPSKGHPSSFKPGSVVAQFQFREEEAHELAALTCMRVMSSASNYLRFVAMYYDDTLDDPPFLRYVFEYWSHHFRAAPLPFMASRPDLIHQAAILVRKVTDTTLCTLGALATAISRIEPHDANDMRFVICMRDAESSLLPATEALCKILDLLPRSVMEFKEAHNNIAAVCRHSQKTGKTFAPDQLQSCSITPTTIPNLPTQRNADSPISVQLHIVIEKYPDLLGSLSRSAAPFEDAARKIRLVTMSLCIDPVRTWLYTQLQLAPVSPIPLLAHASHIIEVFASSAVFPLLEGDCVNVRHQYYYEPDHPLYGPMTCVRYELAIRHSDYLTESFYQEYILPQLTLYYWERLTILASLMLLPLYDGHPCSCMINFMTKHWITSVLQAQLDTEDAWTSTSPFVIWGALGPPRQGRAPARPTRDIVNFVVGVVMMVWVRLITIVFHQMDTFLTTLIIWGYFGLKESTKSFWESVRRLSAVPVALWLAWFTAVRVEVEILPMVSGPLQITYNLG